MSREQEMDNEVVAVGKKKKPKGVIETIIDDVVVPNISDIRTTFVNEILIPNTLDWLLDLGTNFLSNILQTPYDSSGRGYSRSSRRYKNYGDSYDRIHGKRERRSERVDDVRDYESIYFDTRQDAERILSRMQADIRKYDGTVTIQDLNSYCGLKSSWTDAKYGWTNLDKARTYRGRDGKYYIELPEPFPIDDD